MRRDTGLWVCVATLAFAPAALAQRPVLVEGRKPVVVRVSVGGGVAFPNGGSLRQLDPDLAGLARLEFPRLVIPLLDLQFEGRIEGAITDVGPSPRAGSAVGSATLGDLLAGIVVKDWGDTRGPRLYGFVMGGLRLIRRDTIPTRTKSSAMVGFGVRYQPLVGPIPFVEAGLNDAFSWGSGAARAITIRVGVSALQF